MTQGFMKGVIEKNLKVKKAPNVQGCVKIHFPTSEIQDYVLTNHEVFEVFARIGVTQEEVKRSNLQVLISRGDIVTC